MEERKGINLVGGKEYSISLSGYDWAAVMQCLRTGEYKVFVCKAADSLEKQLQEQSIVGEEVSEPVPLA